MKKYVTYGSVKENYGEWVFVKGKWIYKKPKRLQVVKIFDSKPHRFDQIIFT